MWATLLLMVVLKLTFNYYYPIVIENSKLLEISKYIDDNKWLRYILHFILHNLNGVLLSLCLLHEKWFRNIKQFVWMIIPSIVAFVVKLIDYNIGSYLILIPYLIIPIFITKQPKRWILITFILDNIFQILSNLARGNSIINNNTFILEQMMLIDYYLLFIIYYIGGCHMGLSTWLPWFTKKETVINAKIEKLEKKIKKLEEQKVCLKKR